MDADNPDQSDEQVVDTVPAKSALDETVSKIMLEKTEEHPYVYHYDP